MFGSCCHVQSLAASYKGTHSDDGGRGAALTALDPINPLITLIPLLNVFSIPFTGSFSSRVAYCLATPPYIFPGDKNWPNYRAADKLSINFLLLTLLYRFPPLE